jgi:hypothetical protein
MAALVVRLLACADVLGAEADDAAQSQVSLRLTGALLKPVRDGSDSVPCDLQLDLWRQKDRYAPTAWAYAHQYNRADHWGTVEELAAGREETRLRVKLAINEDGWIGGGRAAYQVALRCVGDKVQGSFTGTFNARNVAGDVAGVVRKPWLMPLEAKPIRAHPRLVFTKNDLLESRKRAETPEGKAMIEVCRKGFWDLEKNGFGYREGQAFAYVQSYHAFSHGFMSRLTGDKALVERAKALLVEGMKGGAAQDEMWSYAQRIVGVALAYDSLHDELDEPFRKEVRAYLRHWARYLTERPDDLRTQGASALINGLQPYSPDLVMFRAAAGVAALAVLGDPSDEPVRPETRTIQADPQFRPGEGAPVAELEHDRCLTDFLALYGPLEDPAWRPNWVKMQELVLDQAGKRTEWMPNEGAEADPLAAIGGSHKAQPQAGTEVTYRNETNAFRALAKEMIFRSPYTDGRPSVQLFRDVHLKGQTVDYYYAVIRNDRPRWVKVDLGDRTFWTARIFLGGKEINELEAVRVEAGLHPLLIQCRVPSKQLYSPYYPAFYGVRGRPGRKSLWHWAYTCLDSNAMHEDPGQEMWMTPRLLEVEDPTVAWERSRRQWRADGGSDAEDMARIASLAMRTVERFLAARTISAQGVPAENSSYGDTIEFIAYFLHAWRTTTGQDGIRGTPLQRVFPATVLTGNWDTEVWRALPVLAGYVRAEDRGVVRWLMDQRRPVPFNSQQDTAYGMRFPHALAYAMLHYPWETQARPPEEALPLAWQDEESGTVAFRNRFMRTPGSYSGGITDALKGQEREWGQEDNTFALLAHGSTLIARNAGLAGTFTLQGLGLNWSSTFKTLEAMPKYPLLAEFNTVVIEGCLPEGGARLLSFAGTKDGGGQARFEMDRAYRGARFEGLYHLTPAAVEVIGRCLGAKQFAVRWGKDGGYYDAGIRALRCVAADYSGKSGAPALWVVVDKFTGADKRRKAWLMNVGRLDFQAKALGAQAQADVHAITVTVPAENGPPRVLYVRFVGVPEPKPEFIKLGGNSLYRCLTPVPGGAGSDGFFVVITLRRGAPPEMKVEGAGLDARVTVGERRIRFDGERIVLE